MNFKKIINFIITNQNQIFLTIALILFGIVSRILSHTVNFMPNFSPVAAIALFSGFYFKGKWQIIMPLLIMLTSDSFIGFYSLGIMLAVYICIILNAFLGRLINKEKIGNRLLPIALLGSSIFYLVTNFAVWSLSSWYPHTIAGLLNCYYLALPFFRNTLLGDVFYSGVLFGAYAVVHNLAKNRSSVRAQNLAYEPVKK
jgi:hypothetical protein